MGEAIVADLDFCDSVVPGRPCWGVAVGVSSPAELAGGVTVGVVLSAIAEVASSADIAEVASSADLAEVASSPDLAGDVTVGVMSSAIAEVASLADLAEVASSADLARDVTISVTSLADPARVVTAGVAFQ